MLAENVYQIAQFLSEEEMIKLYDMLGKKIKQPSISKVKKRKLITDKEAIDYLLKNIFLKPNLKEKKL